MSLLSRRWNYLKYGLRNKYFNPNHKYKDYAYDANNINQIKDFLNQFDTKAAVVFVGIRQARQSLGLEDPIVQIQAILDEIYGSVIVPTYTYSVRESQKFDVVNTRSETGVFSRHFMENADYRSMSPIKSYALKGQAVEEFSKLNHFDDYGLEGSFEYFRKSQITTINIGTDEIRPICIHYSEYLAKVPYMQSIKRNVLITDKSGKSEDASVSDLISIGSPVKVNRIKLEKDLLENKLSYNLKINDFVVRVMPQQNYFDFFMDRLKKNPYYLVD